NIAESIFHQMALEQHPIPAWVVLGAGTGGTSATIGRYMRLMRYRTRLCVVDPEDSIFYSHWTGDPSTFTGRPSRIEGIGRQRVEPSFLPDIVDRMLQVPDAASISSNSSCSSSLRATRWQPGTTSPHLNCFIGAPDRVPTDPSRCEGARLASPAAAAGASTIAACAGSWPTWVSRSPCGACCST